MIFWDFQSKKGKKRYWIYSIYWKFDYQLCGKIWRFLFENCYCVFLKTLLGNRHSQNLNWNKRCMQVSGCSENSTRANILWLLGQPIFWPRNLKFWLYNLQIFTLFWPINFLHLQMQNNSALGVEVNPEAYSRTLCFEILKYLVVQLWEWHINKYINNYSRVKPENIIKFKHYMHNGLSIYQTKYFKTTFLASPCLCYCTYYSIVQ